MVAAKSRTVLQALAEYEYVIMELEETTQRGYRQRIGRFARWCQGKRLYLKNLTPAIIASYLQELRKPSERTGDPLSTYTLHGHMRAIRAFLNWCARPPQRYLDREIPENLIMPKIDIKVIEIFSTDQIHRLQVAVTQNHFPIMVARDKAILAILLDTGVRASELCSLRCENVHITSSDGYIKIRGKGRREREVPLGRKARQLLNDYLKHYRQTEQGEPCVFLSHEHKPLTDSALRQMFKRWARRAGIVGVRCSPHTCRHWFAINFLLPAKDKPDEFGNIYVLSRLLGHASISVTEVYLRAAESIWARRISKSVLDNL